MLSSQRCFKNGVVLRVKGNMFTCKAFSQHFFLLVMFKEWRFPKPHLSWLSFFFPCGKKKNWTYLPIFRNLPENNVPTGKKKTKPLWYSEGKIIFKNAQLEKNAEMLMLSWTKVFRYHAQVGKYAQIKMLRWKNMLRFKCSGGKICSDKNSQK